MPLYSSLNLSNSFHLSMPLSTFLHTSLRLSLRFSLRLFVRLSSLFSDPLNVTLTLWHTFMTLSFYAIIHDFLIFCASLNSLCLSASLCLSLASLSDYLPSSLTLLMSLWHCPSMKLFINLILCAALTLSELLFVSLSLYLSLYVSLRPSLRPSDTLSVSGHSF